MPETMSGVALTGHGGMDKLVWREDLPGSAPAEGEVLIRVTASAVNNTDINTRIGWYSKAVRGDTSSGAVDGLVEADDKDGGWSGTPLRFPRIQGADCCGVIVAAGAGVSAERIGERVLVRALQTTGAGGDPFSTWTFGSECDGAFSEYTKTFAEDALPVTSPWTDLEPASIPCASSTAEGMLQRARVGAERILITGASGGVGSAAIQLAKRRGGRYVTSGAIAGPIVELDVRTLYLRDLTLFGATYKPKNILPDVIGYIERDEIRPVIAETFDLRDPRAAQQAFLSKGHVGKIAIQVALGTASP